MLFTFLFKIFVLFVLETIIDGSHFLGGTINWRIQNISDNGTSVAVLITQTYSWTYVTGRCDNSSIANNQAVSGASGSITCSPSCPSGFGTVSAIPYCTDVSALDGVAVGQRLDTLIIPAGSDFWVIFSGNSWNNQVTGSYDWSITSRINLVRRSDNNMFNNAPVATVMSPINIQSNQTTSIIVSVSDADGDIVRCRWANASGSVDECGSVCPPSSLPANTVLNSNCTIQITGSIIGNAYAVTFIVEDFMTSSSTTPLSSVPVQFIVKVIAPSSCSTLPEAILVGQSCTTVTVNETFTTPVLALNNCGTNVSIVDIATVSFSGMVQSSVNKLNSLIYYKTLTWTPTIDQLGYQVMCAIALDSQYTQSLQSCFTFYVTENGTNICPTATDNGTVTVPLTTATTSSTTTVSTIVSSSTTTISSTTAKSNTIQWPLIAGLAVLVLVLAIIYSSCMIKRYVKRSIGTRRKQSYNNNSPKNGRPLVSTRKHPPSAVSKDSVYTIEEETADRSTVCPKSSNDEKTIVDDDEEQLSASAIIYPKSNTIQIPTMEPYRSSTRIKNERIHVKNVPLPVEQMITIERQSQIETIDLHPISPQLEQSFEVENKSISLSNTVQTEFIPILENKVKTANAFDISQAQFAKSRKTKKKHKQSPEIHVTIKQPRKLKQ